MVKVLSGIRNRKCGYNQHLESQAMSLASPTQDGRSMIPLDFIGRVEHFADDFLRMLRHAEEATGLSIPRAQMQGVVMLLNHTQNRLGAPSEKDLGFAALLQHEIQSLRDPRLDRLVSEAYRQDATCFGYKF